MMTRPLLSLLLNLLLLAAGPARLLAAPAETVSSRPLVQAVDAIGLTVSDLDRSVEFFSKVLSFRKVAEVELAGSDYESLYGVFGLRVRVARMKLGDEAIELTEYLAPRG